MSLFGLSFTTWALGAGVLGAAVFALHLLRVRLRRVDVDTLLFFRLAGAVRQPRVLPGRPSRWLALLLALLATMLAWAAIGDPRTGLAAPSRFVVVEPAPGELATERLQLANTLAHEGLGPRGAVLAGTEPPAVLLAADEPHAALPLRGAALSLAASADGAQAALRAAADRMQPGDELLWIGAGAPPIAGVATRAVTPTHAPAAAVRALAWQRGDDGSLSLAVRVEGSLDTELELIGPAGSLARARATAGLADVAIGPFAAPAGAVHLRLAQGTAVGDVTVPLPSGEPITVLVDGPLPGDLARAITAVLAVDAELAPATDVAKADLVIATKDSDDKRPRLVLTPGVGQGERLAHLVETSPVQLSLRDRQRRNAPALPPMTAATVWVEDCRQGAPLVAASAANGRLRVFLVDWLLQPATHADVPLLLATALRELGGRPRALLAAVQQPLALPAAFAAPATDNGAAFLPDAGALRLDAMTAGTRTLDTPAGPRTVHVLAIAAPATVALSPVPDPVPHIAAGGDGAWTSWLLFLLVLLLAADAVLFHRGRLP